MTERWQNGALVALRFFAMKCINHMISGENQQKMTGKSAERAEISAEMRAFLNLAQKIRRTEIFAERRTAQNGNYVNVLSYHRAKVLILYRAKVLMYENNRLWSVL